MFAPRPPAPHAPAPHASASASAPLRRIRFRDRADAGDALAGALGAYLATLGPDLDVAVLGMVRGGVPVARRVADALGASFGALVTRKVGVPGIEEVALGAIAEGGGRATAGAVAWYLGVPRHVLARLTAREHAELERRAALFRGGVPLAACRGRTVVLVDDGLVTGATLLAGVRAVRAQRPARVVVAVPVASGSGAAAVRAEADAVVALLTPADVGTVSAWYDDYDPVSDEAVLRLLGKPACVAIAAGGNVASDVLRDVSDRMAPAASHDGHGGAWERRVLVPVEEGVLVADLGRPQYLTCPDAVRASERVRGLVVLAHGGESSRDSYRNRYVAGCLRLCGYATLRVDLLTPWEQAQARHVGVPPSDVAPVAARLAAVCEWAAREGVPGADRTVLVGASTGAAAALAAAAWRPRGIVAVVARGGRVDLALADLPRVRVPVLLLVGADDHATARANRAALPLLLGPAHLVRIPRAGHTFEEPGAIGAVAERIIAWLGRLERRAPPREAPRPEAPC